MGTVEFTGNYQDLSTDRGYQFKLYCEKCGNGYMSTFKSSKLGLAGVRGSARSAGRSRRRGETVLRSQIVISNGSYLDQSLIRARNPACSKCSSVVRELKMR